MQSFNLNTNFFQDLLHSAHISKIMSHIEFVNSHIEHEFSLTVSEQQINEALHQYVTKNVDAILEMKVACHDGWFRLQCIVNIAGIYGHVAANYELVHVQLDRHRQRLVFAQQSPTEILELHATSYLKRRAIETALPLFKKIKKTDPLHELFRRTNLAKIKDNVIYIDIGRWLRNSESLMENLQKFQINYAYVHSEQLVLKSNVNPKNILPNIKNQNVITEKDNPAAVKHHNNEAQS